MKIKLFFILIFFLWVSFNPSYAFANDEDLADPFEKNSEQINVPDNFPNYNRFVHSCNEKMYYSILLPLSYFWRGIFFIPELPLDLGKYIIKYPFVEKPRFEFGSLRTGINYLFKNIAFPGQMFNNFLQGKPIEALKAPARFIVNAFAAEMYDFSNHIPALKAKDKEDFDQTLGVWGYHMGGYFVVPFYGPCSYRGLWGILGDIVFSPLTYIPIVGAGAGCLSIEKINYVSLNPTEYDDLKKGMLDPYTGIRDAYIKYTYEHVNK